MSSVLWPLGLFSRAAAPCQGGPSLRCRTRYAKPAASFSREDITAEVAEKAEPDILAGAAVKEEDASLEAAVRPRSVDERAFLLQVLDSCLETQDMDLVTDTYGFLREKGLIPNFGRYKQQDFEASERLIAPTAMKDLVGLEVTKLSPKKWGTSGMSAAILVSLIVLQSVFRNNNIDTRIPLVFLMSLALVDSIYLGGVCVSQIQSFWLPHRRRVRVHEAGHILVAYLLGCPVRGVVLDAFQAMKIGIQGQAGTQFWDSTLQEELLLGRLESSTIDRYSMVLFAGIAAEALVYGAAEGGENDENIFMAVVAQLSPPWSAAKRGNQARWAVVQSFRLLERHRHVHTAVTDALENGATMSLLVKTIEDQMQKEQGEPA